MVLLIFAPLTSAKIFYLKHLQTIILLVLILLPALSQAQLSLGFKGGANLSTLEFVQNADFRFKEPQYKNGFQGGLMIQYISGPHVGIQAEINYSQRGWSEAPRPKEDPANVVDLKYEDRRINYVEMPVLTHAYFGNGKFRFMINLGPYAAYALNANYTISDYDGNKLESGAYQFNKDRDNRFDFGLLAGGGFEYELPVGIFYAEARYVYGFGNIYKTVADAAEASQNRVIDISVGFNYHIGKKARESKPKTDQP